MTDAEKIKKLEKENLELKRMIKHEQENRSQAIAELNAANAVGRKAAMALMNKFINS